MLAAVPWFLGIGGSIGAPRSGALQGADAPVSAPGRVAGYAAQSVVAGRGPVDSARIEVQRGRYLRAVSLLREALVLADASPSELLLLARAEAGRRNWEGVRGVLEDQSWLETEANGEGFYLLGRAHEADESWAAAADAFDRRTLRLRTARIDAALGDAPPPLPVVGPTALPAEGALTRPDPLDPLESAARRALNQGRSEPAGARVLDLIGDLSRASPVVGSWVALDLARAAARRGEVETVRALIPAISDPEAVGSAWDLEERAHLASGDTAAAIRGYDVLAEGDTRPAAWASIGELELLTGNRDSAAVHLRHVLRLQGSGGPAIRAALGLVGIGGTDGTLSLQIARILRIGGENRAAIRAYDRAVEGLGGVAALDPDERLARAILLGNGGRVDDAVAEFTALSQVGADPSLGAAALAAWARVRRAQGRQGDVRTLEDRLISRFPTTPEAADVHFFRGDASHDIDALDAARTEYAATMTAARSSDRGGLSAMRLAQLHLREGATEDASAIWEEYLETFPDGRRWGEAQYWAAASALALGDTSEWNAGLDRISEREPFSYYAVLASEERGRTYAPSLPAGPIPEAKPGWMDSGLTDLFVLDRIGFTQATDRILAGLEAASEASEEHRRLLAEELVRHGRPLDGINIGWSLLGDGEPWSMRMVRIVYPFPFAELVREEAREKGLDPALLAGLIRQESAFVPTISSAAGARGLTQVMPATGRDLAASAQISGYTDESLFSAETNLLLGTHYLVDLDDRYSGAMEYVLSAYNAGPARADAWQRFEEAAEVRRFIERIPFTETRGYVKNVLRNRAIYAWLWAATTTTP